MTMKVLIACEFSGRVRDAFIALGHDAMSCDLLPTEVKGPHHEGHVEDVIDEGWDLMIAHPPCTCLSRAGWSWVNKPDSALGVMPLKGEPRRLAAFEAARFFYQLINAPIPRIAVENPRPIVHVGLPKATQSIQPWQFGHGEKKETCLWLKGLPKLVPTNVVNGREAIVHRMPPGPDRWKNRSRTYLGIAQAMAEQWGKE